MMLICAYPGAQQYTKGAPVRFQEAVSKVEIYPRSWHEVLMVLLT
ncbi:hypothetical protein Desti_1784 [Desulfomonile tiedjei DSM 6799]|uniref:Uncharacterized protein n=1 Tax=Desulfomonile tiedjei (strain ATCC 49306 / DSM 6799 / DCB-1) TaxID=706587 RepID=I4C4K2_DESTA|nr:hypothetical protein Desti_1784 [Desulfomonile tiedjei DSM 6799]